MFQAEDRFAGLGKIHDECPRVLAEYSAEDGARSSFITAKFGLQTDSCFSAAAMAGLLPFISDVNTKGAILQKLYQTVKVSGPKIRQ